MPHLEFAISIIINGIIFSLSGVLVERLLIRCGLVRGYTNGVILGCFFIALVKAVLDNQQVYWIYWFAASVLAPVSLNRSDIIASATKGRWWWKSENHLDQTNYSQEKDSNTR